MIFILCLIEICTKPKVSCVIGILQPFEARSPQKRVRYWLEHSTVNNYFPFDPNEIDSPKTLKIVPNMVKT